MGISSSITTGVTGITSNAEAINVIGNNIANVNTPGFKSGRTLFSNLLSTETSGFNSQIGHGVSVQYIENQFTQGTILRSENVTDLAIGGNGFFVVQDTASSVTYYTRAGAFQPDITSKYLVNPDGYALCDSQGAPIDLSAMTNFHRVRSIGTDGTITYVDTAGVDHVAAPKIGLATFSNPAGLEKAGGTVYRATLDAEGSGEAAVAASLKDTIFSGSLEESNVDMARQLVDMIVTQRAYSANAKSIITSDEMVQNAINLKQ